MNPKDKKEWEEIYRLANTVAMYQYKRSYSLKNDPAVDVEDVRQQLLEAFIRWMKVNKEKVATLDGGLLGLWKAWSHNQGPFWVVSNWTRSKGYGPVAGTGGLDENEVEMTNEDEVMNADVEEDPYEDISKTDYTKYMHTIAKEVLSDRQYEAFELYMSGISQREMSAELDISPPRVNQLIRLAMTKVQRAMDKDVRAHKNA